MNVVIEGPDNAGKSTLIKFLESNLSRSVIHNSVDKDSSSVLGKQAKELSLEGDIIYDRSAVISEYIYCLVLRRTPVININLGSVIDIVDNTVTIFCMPPIDKVLATTKDEMPGVRENLQALYEAYDNLVDELACSNKRFFIYDWTTDTEEDVLHYIKNRNMEEWKK